MVLGASVTNRWKNCRCRGETEEFVPRASAALVAAQAGGAGTGLSRRGAQPARGCSPPRLQVPEQCLPSSSSFVFNIFRYVLLLFNFHNFNSRFFFYVLFLSVNHTQTCRPRVDLVLSCVKLLEFPTP